MKEPYYVLLESEGIKTHKTQLAIPQFYEFVPHFYNVFMKLPFYCGELAEETDKNKIKIQDVLQFFIYDFPFKLRNIQLLMENGSYADAVILYRSLVENFICYKYFISKNDGEGLSKYINRKTKKTIKDIFEGVVPGYYDDIYAELCKFTHGNPLTQGIFRGNVSQNQPLKSNIENINVNWFAYIYNQLLPLIIGVFEMYKIVFPNNTTNSDTTLIKELDYIYKFIKFDIAIRKEEYPRQKAMIDYYNNIIEM
ncbi:MAG: DUF5677 domain-containing protein [Clostridia bacterium]|nr:DUF5677 domain-containing protein [Clostridia bacterium]MDD4386172.1 DUF5677 domain-containing protein [Clostridia bacterium]